MFFDFRNLSEVVLIQELVLRFIHFILEFVGFLCSYFSLSAFHL